MFCFHTYVHATPLIFIENWDALKLKFLFEFERHPVSVFESSKLFEDNLKLIRFSFNQMKFLRLYMLVVYIYQRNIFFLHLLTVPFRLFAGTKCDMDESNSLLSKEMCYSVPPDVFHFPL